MFNIYFYFFRFKFSRLCFVTIISNLPLAVGTHLKAIVKLPVRSFVEREVFFCVAHITLITLRCAQLATAKSHNRCPWAVIEEGKQVNITLKSTDIRTQTRRLSLRSNVRVMQPRWEEPLAQGL